MIYEILPVNNYQGNGTTRVFDFDFYIDNESQLIVWLYDENNNKIKLFPNVDYTIDRVKNKNGSYITFPIEGSSYEVLKENQKISLELTLPISQETQYNNSSLLNLEALEYSLDYLTRLIQILSRKIDLCVKVNECSVITPDELITSINEAKITAQNFAKTAELQANNAINSTVMADNYSNNAQQQAQIAQNALLQCNELLSSTANIELNNLSYGGEKHFLNKSQISNAVLSVPCNCDMELIGNILTIKQGSIIIVPYGKSVPEYNKNDDFNESFIIADIDYDNNRLFYNLQLKNNIQVEIQNESNNLVLFDVNAGLAQAVDFNIYSYNEQNNTIENEQNLKSFPVGIVNSNEIVKTFNGFGFIGSTMWMDKNVQYLIPNGINNDGTMKNIEVVSSKIVTATNNNLQTNSYAIKLTPDGNIDIGPLCSKYYIQNTKPSSNILDSVWYDINENKIYINDGTMWQLQNNLIVQSINSQSNNIISLNNLNPIEFLKKSDSDYLSGLAMPSNRWVELSYADGFNYTAPANGYFYFYGRTNGATTAQLSNRTKNFLGHCLYQQNGAYFNLYVPAEKGDLVFPTCTNNSANTIGIRFYYAQGAI